MDISNKLKNNRKQAGYTQEQISQRLHVSRQTISNWETGKNVPDIYSLVESSILYDVSLDDLIKEDILIMNELKKENKEKKILNITILLSGVGLFLLLISVIINNSHIQSLIRGAGIGMLIVTATVLLLVKVLRKIYT